MPSSKEITSKIGSVKNTRKVTRALEMVSASKIRKAQARMEAARPYARMMRQVISHLSEANPEYKHPFTVTRDNPGTAGYIVVSSDRGLCGGLNNNLFRRLLRDIREWQDNDVGVQVVTIGRKGGQFFRNLRGVEIPAHADSVSEQPQIEDLVGVVKVALDAYREEKLDRVYLCYNDFINTMSQKPVINPLLPLPPAEDDEQMLEYWDYIYEPDARDLLNDVLTRYIESLVYHAVLENQASEHAARMIAMKSASDNADEIIDELNLAYNKARQAAITQEISEIVSGAEAV